MKKHLAATRPGSNEFGPLIQISQNRRHNPRRLVPTAYPMRKRAWRDAELPTDVRVGASLLAEGRANLPSSKGHLCLVAFI
jgi:hypothetical protein